MSTVLENIKFLAKLGPDLEKNPLNQSVQFNSESCSYLLNIEYQFKSGWHTLSKTRHEKERNFSFDHAGPSEQDVYHQNHNIKAPWLRR